MRPREFDQHPVSFQDAMQRGLWRGIGKGAHDGDTLIVFADKGMYDYQMVTLRLLGVWAPEVVGTTGDVLTRARAAKTFVEDMTTGHPLLFRTFTGGSGSERMSFDRYLARVTRFAAGVEVDLGEELITNGLADSSRS